MFYRVPAHPVQDQSLQEGQECCAKPSILEAAAQKEQPG